MVGYFAVLDAYDVDRLEMNLAMSWSDSKKWPLMSAVVRLVRSHSIAISKLLMDLRMKVRERNAKIGVEFPHTGFVGCRPRLRCVVDEIVSEELVENVEVSPPLDLLGVSADDGFSRFGQSDDAHIMFAPRCFRPKNLTSNRSNRLSRCRVIFASLCDAQQLVRLFDPDYRQTARQ